MNRLAHDDGTNDPSCYSVRVVITGSIVAARFHVRERQSHDNAHRSQEECDTGTSSETVTGLCRRGTSDIKGLP